MKQITIFLLIFSLLFSVQSQNIEINELSSPQKDSWWLFNTGNETLKSFAPINDSNGFEFNASISTTLLEDNITELLTYNNQTDGFNIGFDVVREGTFNTLQKVRFSYISFEKTIKSSMKFSISAITNNVGYHSNSTKSNNYSITVSSQEYVFDKINYDAFYYKGEIDYHYQKSLSFEIQNNRIERLETFGNGTVISTITFDNGTIIKNIDFFPIGYLIFITSGWYVPDIYRVVETNFDLKSNLGLDSIPHPMNIESAFGVKKLLDYNLVQKDIINNIVNTPTSEDISTPTSSPEITTEKTAFMIFIPMVIVLICIRKIISYQI